MQNCLYSFNQCDSSVDFVKKWVDLKYSEYFEFFENWTYILIFLDKIQFQKNHNSRQEVDGLYFVKPICEENLESFWHKIRSMLWFFTFFEHTHFNDNLLTLFVFLISDFALEFKSIPQIFFIKSHTVKLGC